MGLSDTISDSIQTLLQGVNNYNDYSNEYSAEIVHTLTIMYHTLFMIDSAGLHGVIQRDLQFCNLLSMKEFNRNFNNLNDEDYKHCQDCYCPVCLTLDRDGPKHTHDGCEGNNCVVVKI